MIPKIETDTLQFLKALSKNNNRDWFQKHRGQYEAAQTNVIQFFDQLLTEMNKHDDIQNESGKKSIYRIYNDVRFSKDKKPYNPRFAGYLKRRKPQLRGGYYLWIKPGGSKLGCGFAYPNADDLLRIRKDIEINYPDWRRLLKRKTITSTFGGMLGDQVKTAPRGFPKDHVAIDLLRNKQFWFERSCTDKEVLAPDFLMKVNQSYKSIRPFFDYMSEVLGTDLNGVSILS